jgi:hypothetical protein
LLYTILTVIFTYPVAFSSNLVPGLGDVYYYIWDFWWYKTALVQGLYPFYTTYVFYPLGASLVFSDATFFNVILSIPLQHYFGFITAYNFLWLFSFILSGFGMFLLAKYLTGSNQAAFISGIIFMFSPIRFVHALGHLSLITTGFIPIFVLFLIKTFKEDQKRNPLLAGIFLALVWYSSYYFFLFLVVFSFIYLIYLYLTHQISLTKVIFIRIGIISLVTGILISFIIVPMAISLFWEHSMSAYVGGFESNSADLLSFFIPSTIHPYYGTILSIFPGLYEKIVSFGIEGTVFAGYTVLFLSILAVFKIKTKDVQFWFFSAIIFAIISLGPILHVNGNTEFTVSNFAFSIPLPYYFLMKMPVFSLARAPGRWDILVVLSMAVLAGYGLKSIFDKYKDCRFLKIPVKNGIAILFSCLILFEFLSVPFPMQNAGVPQFYNNLSHETGDFAIIEVPGLCCNFGMQDYQYYQTVHNKRLVGGYLGRVEIPNYPSFINSLIQLYSLGGELDYTKDIINQNLTEIGPQVLSDYNVRYIILHKNLMSPVQFSYADNLLKNTLNEEPTIYENNTLIIYQVPRIENRNIPYITLGKNWYDVEAQFSEKIMPYRAVSNDATLTITSKKSYDYYLTLELMSIYSSKNITIFQEGLNIQNFIVHPNYYESIKIPLNLNEGKNEIRIHSNNGCIKLDVVYPQLNDDRCISIVVRNVSLVKIKS